MKKRICLFISMLIIIASLGNATFIQASAEGEVTFKIIDHLNDSSVTKVNCNGYNRYGSTEFTQFQVLPNNIDTSNYVWSITANINNVPAGKYNFSVNSTDCGSKLRGKFDVTANDLSLGQIDFGVAEAASDSTTQVVRVHSLDTPVTVADDGVAKITFSHVLGTKSQFCPGTITLTPVQEASDAVSLSMKYGAAMRLNDQTGMRFYTNVDNADKEKIAKLRADGATVEMGTLIAPEDLLAGEELTFDIPETNRIDVKYETTGYYTKDDFSGIVGSIVGIKENKNENRRFVGRGYVKVTRDGKTTISYAAYAENNVANNTRTISWIAVQLRNDTAAYENLSSRCKAVVDKYAAMYIA